MAAPPVTRFLDFGQYKYELTKKEKEAKRRQRSVTFKEVRLSPKIGTGDFDTKVHRAVEFLSDGDRIKVTVRFRGRELTHPELGRKMLDRFADQVKDHGAIERPPVLEGKSMFITLASTHKPKSETGPNANTKSDGGVAEPVVDAAPAPAAAPAAAKPKPAPSAEAAPATAAPAAPAAPVTAATTPAATKTTTKAAAAPAAPDAPPTGG
jgi:translation initiation factor IF-3